VICAANFLGDIMPNTSLYSTALKLNTQYMHTIRFSIHTRYKYSRKDVIDKFDIMALVALTEKTSANKIFSFGREYGVFGRILNQAVICTPTIDVHDSHDGGSIIRGVSFTSQDGNSLLSSVYATLHALSPDSVEDRMCCLDSFIFDHI